MSTVISIENVSKQYRLGEVGTGTLSHDLNRWWYKFRGKEDPYLMVGESNDRSKKGASDYSWALKDVSFEVKQGEVLGIIGRNGAGKSTLLKILSRVTTPTAGAIKIKGRIASLLEVGTGFHPELSGRENIYLNGAILGMRKAEISSKFDEIVDFSGCERYIDTPVKRYSSGMYVRLAFAVAAHLEPEILIVDEVLAVGDAEFQKKCMGKMKDVAGQGRTVIFVSHNMSGILNLCSSAVFLAEGKMIRSGAAKEIVAYYLRQALPEIIGGRPLLERIDRKGSGKLRISSFRIEDDSGSKIHEAVSGMNVTFVVGYTTLNGNNLTKVDPGISIQTEVGEAIFVHYSSYNAILHNISGPSGELRFRMENLPLTPGSYIIGARIVVDGEEADWPQDGIGYLKVEAGDFYNTGSKGCEGSTTILIDGKWISN